MNKRTIALLGATLLVSACSSFKEAMRDPAAGAPPVTRLTLLPYGPVAPGSATGVDAKLNLIEDRVILADKDLLPTHGQKLQLLAVDPAFTDFRVIVPQSTSTPGLYHFEFTPKSRNGYRVWAEATPALTQRLEFPSATLGTLGRGAFDRTESLEAAAGVYRVTLRFDSPLERDNESTGTLDAATASGGEAPVTLHDVYGLLDDFRTVLHFYPGAGKDNAFVIRPSKNGYVKFFARVSINGQEMTVPFTATIRDNR